MGLLAPDTIVTTSGRWRGEFAGDGALIADWRFPIHVRLKQTPT